MHRRLTFRHVCSNLDPLTGSGLRQACRQPSRQASRLDRSRGLKGDRMSLLSGGRVRWAALGVIVGALAVGGIAWADIPDSGMIHGCYQKVTRQLRVIDTSKCEGCKTSAMPLG